MTRHFYLKINTASSFSIRNSAKQYMHIVTTIGSLNHLTTRSLPRESTGLIMKQLNAFSSSYNTILCREIGMRTAMMS